MLNTPGKVRIGSDSVKDVSSVLSKEFTVLPTLRGWTSEVTENKISFRRGKKVLDIRECNISETGQTNRSQKKVKKGKVNTKELKNEEGREESRGWLR